MANNAGNNFANQAWGNTSKGNGYSPYGEIIGNNMNSGALDTTSDPVMNDDKWARWFGTPPYSSYQRDNYADLGHENYQLPTAYVGRNLHIEKVLNVSVASTDDFYTRVLLPWRVYDGMKITFSKWSGFDHVMYQTPEEVPAPQIQTRFEQGEAYQQRYGLAFKMEHGFQRTEMGRQAYSMNLAIITQAVLRTVYARVMQVLVQNRNWLAVIAAKTFPSAMVQAREVSKASVNSFGCVQKNTFGLDLILNNVQKLFRDKMLQQPDALVIPAGCLAYLSTCKPESRIYALCGQLAEKLDLKSERELVTNVYNNNYSVFEHRPMQVSDDSNEVNMLVREREVGNVFRLFRNTVEEYDYTGPTAVKIIDHDKMRWSTFSLGSVLKRTQIWSGEQVDVTGNGGQSNAHLENYANNPLRGKNIIGDLDPSQLRESTLRSAIRSIERLLNLSPGVMQDISTNQPSGWRALASRLRQLCPNNIWHKKAVNTSTDNLLADDVVGAARTGMDPPVVGSSVEDVAVALQAAILGTIGSDLDDATVDKATSSSRINEAVAELAGVTSEMSDIQRKSIADAFDQTAPRFKSAKSALKKFLKNPVDTKSAALETAYVEALTGDFKREWKTISSTAKEIAATIGVTASGQKEANDTMGVSNLSAKVKQIVQKMRLPAMQRFIAKWYLGCSIDLPTIVGLDEAGILTPFGAFLFRPFQSFSMGSGIIMKAGNETGFTAVGNSDFQLGDNVTNKTHLGHFTFYFEPVVHEPNHIMIMRDICFMGYNGGAGCEFFSDWSEVTSNIRNGNGVRASLCAALAFHHESLDEFRQDPMSISGEFADGSILKNLETVEGKMGVTGTNAKGYHYESAGYYRKFLEQQASDLMIDDETKAASDMAFYGSGINFVCYQGLTAHQSASRSFDNYEINTGHLGDSETVDSSMAWSGHLSFKSSVDYHRAGNSVSLMNKST